MSVQNWTAKPKIAVVGKQFVAAGYHEPLLRHEVALIDCLAVISTR